ncbi:MAG: hypothetical protein O3B24_00810 [Verrucomicrobia bacterium]|nr:hypothetical protein [Verrucomicrobiota bacterium]
MTRSPDGLVTFRILATLGLCLLSTPLPCALAEAVEAPVRTESFTWGPVKLEFVFTPATLTINRDVLLDITVTAPSDMEVSIPPLDDRLGGMLLAGQFEDEPVKRDNVVTRRLHYRLTPEVADEYRLAPLAVTYTDARSAPAVSGWFPTQPIVLPSQSPFAGDPGSALTTEPQPLHIRPAFTTVAGYALLALLGVGILFALWKLTRHVRKEIALRMLSPRERALHELRSLLARGLVERGQVKEFYVALTMIVRRYIERRHGVRAPEQTTEEFLQAVSKDTRFTPAVLERLRAFLQAADRVKFAAHEPGRDAIQQATTTAEAYVTSEAETSGTTASGSPREGGNT